MRKELCTLIFGALSCLLLPVQLFAQFTETKADLRTIAEASNYEATSSSAEVEDFIVRAVAASPNITSFQYGETVEGRPMTALVCANPPFEMGQSDMRSIALVIGNIHSGECCGKEAILELVREIASVPKHPWLEKMVIVFVPNYNADGNDQVAKNNRPGQVGPVNGMGKRETTEGYDLNRDFVKLDSQEGRAMVGLIDKLNPHMFIDCHTTNGSRHQYQLTYDVPHNPSSPEPIRQYLREEMMPKVTEQLWNNDIKTFYYGNFDRNYSKWETYGYEPRYSTEYVGMRGRLAILSEAYSYISFEDRINATHEFVTICLDYLDQNDNRIKNLLTKVENDWKSQFVENGKAEELHLRADLQPFEKKFEVYGYNKDEPKIYNVDFVSNYIPTVSKAAPKAYLFSGDLKLIAARLRAHGIKVEELSEEWAGDVEVATVDKIERSTRPFQKHFMTTLDVTYANQNKTFQTGDFRVSTNQPLGRLAAYILESQTIEGFVTWNYLDDQIKEGGEYPIFRVNK